MTSTESKGRDKEVEMAALLAKFRYDLAMIFDFETIYVFLNPGGTETLLGSISMTCT